jgi:hydroxypyruvate isomerase
MKLSACIEWLFAKEYPDFADRIRAAKRAGLDAVEFHLWREKPLTEIRRALDETGLKLNAIVVDPRCRLPDPSTHDAFRKAFSDTLATAEQLGASYVIPSVGPALPGVPIETQRETIVRAIKEATQIAENSPVQILLEPVNSAVDHPGMYLNNTREGLDIVERVAAPNLRLLYDIYHSATMGEVPEQLFGNRKHLVGYVQVADSPGRQEPGTGSIDWRRYQELLRSLSYQGAIGLEFKPSADTLAAISATKRALGKNS